MALGPVTNVQYRIKRGLAGYVNYLAACEMNQSFSEYILYEPTPRIPTAQGWIVECEVACPGYEKKGAGDHKKIDFVAVKSNVAVEVKWAKTPKVKIDIDKLRHYLKANPGSKAFLTVFGAKKCY